jgi:hypothetical protein
LTVATVQIVQTDKNIKPRAALVPLSVEATPSSVGDVA